MPEIDSVRSRVRAFVLANFYVPSGDALRDDTSLFDGGYVDSTGVLELIAFIENEFAIRVEDAETVPENLDSIERVARFIERKRKLEPSA